MRDATIKIKHKETKSAHDTNATIGHQEKIKVYKLRYKCNNCKTRKTKSVQDSKVTFGWQVQNKSTCMRY